MKKLARYSDFNTLKLDNKSTNVNLNGNDKYLNEQEDFLILLRSKYASKKVNNQKFTDGQ
jgi:hypothetical protein